MKTQLLAASGLMVLSLLGGSVHAQVAGGTPQAVIADVALGWSAKNDILGKTVYNEKNQKVGTIRDIIIAPDTSISSVIVDAGGFLGLGRHYVAVDADDLQSSDGKFVLPGATKDMLKAMPTFEYAKKK